MLNSFYFFGFKSLREKISHPGKSRKKISVLMLPETEKKKYVSNITISFNFSLIAVNVIPINFT